MGLLHLLTYIKKTVHAVTAGDTDKVIPIDKHSVTLSMSPKLQIEETDSYIDINDYDVYQVQGESMCTSRIFDQDYVFAKSIDLKNISDIQRFSTIILKIDPKREKLKNPDYIEETYPKYKLRKFVMYVDLGNPDDDYIFDSLLIYDSLSSFQGNRERFIRKLSEAREYFKEQLVILSTTYKEGERDYSFHNVELLIGVVDYLASPSLQHVRKVTSVNENPQLYKEMVEHLSQKKIPRFFYGINNEQAIIVLSSIFSTSEKIVRLVSNKLSTEITSDESYKEALTKFLNKSGTRLEVFVYYYESNNPIYDFFNQYKDKITLKYSKGAKFTLNDRIINFCIGDDRMFRIEKDTELRRSECNFKDVKTCENLIRSFNQIYESDSSEKIF